MNKVHANHSAKIIIAGEPLIVSYDHKKLQAKGFIIKSDTPHKIKSHNNLVISIYLDPETEIGKAINTIVKRNSLLKLENDVAAKLTTFFDHSFENHVSDLDLKKFLIRSLITVQLLDTGLTIDNRIQTVIDRIKNAPKIGPTLSC